MVELDDNTTHVLTEISSIVLKYFTPCHKRLYAIRQLGIPQKRIHHSKRIDIITKDDRTKIKDLLNELGLISSQCQTFRYYRNLLFKEIFSWLAV
jgi:hypothetical protein